MQYPEKSCSQCRARKIKCGMEIPQCSACGVRGLSCEFGVRRRPGPPKGFKKRLHGGSGTPRRTSWPPIDIQKVSNEPSDTPVQPQQSNVERGQFSPEPDALGLSSLEMRLFNAYPSERFFSSFPPLNKEQILSTEIDPDVRSALVCSVCAIAVYLDPTICVEMPPFERDRVAKTFVERARTTFRKIIVERDISVTLDIIRVAILLAMYDLFCSPGSKGWQMVGEAVRLAYDMELDQIDSNAHPTSALFSEAEAQEHRSLWWCVYSLDTYTSCSLMRPFAITNTDINTAILVSGDNEGKNQAAKHKIFFPSDPIEMQDILQSLDYTDPHAGNTLTLLTLWMTRSVSKIRKQQLEGKQVEQQLDLFRNIQATIWFCLPENFLDHSPTGDSHQRLIRTELILLLYLCSLSLHSFVLLQVRNKMSAMEPCSLDPILQEEYGLGANETYAATLQTTWDKCIQSCMAIVEVVRNLSSRELSKLSPMVATILWLPLLGLFLQSRCSANKLEQENAESALHVVKAALKRLASVWQIAQRIDDAQKLLCSNPTMLTTKEDACYILETYGSPLISVSSAKINVHIPSMLVPSMLDIPDYQACLSLDGFQSVYGQSVGAAWNEDQIAHMY